MLRVGARGTRIWALTRVLPPARSVVMLKCMTGAFPSPESAGPDGLVTVTRRIDPELLYEAYSRGIFPWADGPVRWYSPDPRALFLRPAQGLPRKIGKTVRRHGLSVTFDRAFRAVMAGCAESHRHQGEWISPAFIEAYTAFHERGHAHSVEVWQGELLVGGLYGVQLGNMFAGESMFHRISNASKVAFGALAHHLAAIGIECIDAQVLNPHTASLGAVVVRRRDFLQLLARALATHNAWAGTKWPEHGCAPQWVTTLAQTPA